MSSVLSLQDLQISEWLPAHGATDLPTLDRLQGRVVVALAFQMLCPGCVAHALPLAGRVRRTFSPEQVAVVGVHTVFEHHDAMTPVALRAFVHEYRLPFPVGVDATGHGPIPRSMQRFALRGTPSWLLFDREGLLRRESFGEAEALALGAEIAMLLVETDAAHPPSVGRNEDHGTGPGGHCDDGSCAAPAAERRRS